MCEQNLQERAFLHFFILVICIPDGIERHMWRNCTKFNMRYLASEIKLILFWSICHKIGYYNIIYISVCVCVCVCNKTVLFLGSECIELEYSGKLFRFRLINPSKSDPKRHSLPIILNLPILLEPVMVFDYIIMMY